MVSMSTREKTITTERNEQFTSQSFSLLPFFIGGVNDSLNPCAITNLVFLSIGMFFLIFYPDKMLRLGFYFILGVFLSSFLVISGFFNAVRASALFSTGAQGFYILTGAFLIFLAWRNIHDWCLYKQTNNTASFKIKFPLSVEKTGEESEPKQKITKKPNLFIGLESRWWPFLLGLILSLLASACPEQLYVTTNFYLLFVENQRIPALASAFCYSLSFIIPLIISLVFMLVISRDKRCVEFLTKYMPTLKIFCSAIFLAIGIGLIFSFLN